MDIIDYEKAIITILKNYVSIYVTIDDDSLIKIYNLFEKNIMFEPLTSCELFYVASYHNFITKNYVEMEKYYLMAIEKGDDNSMRRLGYYHNTITKNYVEMEKYYLMAIDKGNAYAMNNFGHYHDTITKNYIEMEKYYLMAIE